MRKILALVVVGLFTLGVVACAKPEAKKTEKTSPVKGAEPQEQKEGPKDDLEKKEDKPEEKQDDEG